MARGRNAAPSARRGWLPVLALVAAWAGLTAVGLGRQGFIDYEGRYAEVAREMLLSRDWVSPQLDFTLFLNKPPLLYWLTAAVFGVLGPGEHARWITIVAAAATLLATWRLGARLWDERTGRIAAALLATMLGFVLEARQLRPDLILVACTTAAVACWAAAEAAPAASRRGAWLAGMWALLGVGIMAKGFVCLVVAAFPIGIATLRRHGLRGVARLRPGLGCVVLAAVMGPWHVLVSLRHPGFAWDYVVNQHLLFFLDRKLPRDSEGISLPRFWTAFGLRTAPWIVLVPLAAAEGWRGTARAPAADDAATALAWAWAAGVLALFSAAPSRLEHYVLPALPPVALLAARGWRLLAAGAASARAWRVLVALATTLAVVGVLGLTVGPGQLARARLIAAAPALVSLVPLAGTATAATGLAAAVAAWRRAPRAFAATLGAGAVALAAIVVRALALAEPILSWRPVAELIRANAPPDATIVFEAPEEYQLVGGLVFYTRRRVLLIEPNGFVAPTYLQGRLEAVFLPPGDLARRWAGPQPVVFVSDPQRWRTVPDALAPGRYRVLGRSGARWVLANEPAGDGGTATSSGTP